MYTVRTKVTKQPFYDNQDFLMYILREKVGYKPLTKGEADILMRIFQNNPTIFKDPEIMDWEDEDVVLLNIEDDDKYGRPLSCDFEYLLDSMNENDKEKLYELNGRVQGFDHKYTAQNI